MKQKTNEKSQNGFSDNPSSFEYVTSQLCGIINNYADGELEANAEDLLVKIRRIDDERTYVLRNAENFLEYFWKEGVIKCSA